MLQENLNKILEERIGFGKAQLLAILSCILIELSDGAEMMVIGFLNPILKK